MQAPNVSPNPARSRDVQSRPMGSCVTTRCGVCAGFSAGTAAGPFRPADGVDAQAEALLKASTDLLANHKQFMFATRTTLEIVLTSGRELQFEHATKRSIQRPNRFRAERVGDLVDQRYS